MGHRLLTALLTAFYMSRQVFLIFFGDAPLGRGVPRATGGRGRGAPPTPRPARWSTAQDDAVAAAHGEAHGDFTPTSRPGR